jgi:hypothetical protein
VAEGAGVEVEVHIELQLFAHRHGDPDVTVLFVNQVGMESELHLQDWVGGVVPECFPSLIESRKRRRLMKMRIFAAAAALLLFAGYAKADSIPYPNVGTPITTNTDLVVTGPVSIAYFYGFSAADTDTLSIWDVTTGMWVAQNFFNNQTTPVGTMQTLSGVNVGDVLEFELNNLSTGTTLTSDPANDPADPGISHAYVTWYSANPSDPDYIAGIPAGTFVGMEDLAGNQGSDYDYNDDQYVVTGANNVTPEPNSLFLLGTGFLGLLVVGRRTLLA